MDRFWRHALASALAAQALARRRAPDQDVAFTAALLHDIGRLVLVAYHAEGLAAVRAAATVDDADTLPFERALLGVDHAEVGAMVARHWRFPPEVVQAIAAHHGPPGGDGPVGLADLVHVADAIAHALDLEDDPAESVPALVPSSWRRTALDSDEAQLVFRDVEAGVRALSKSLLG
jgi:putative nucleotidyltransferase with HDIG domain